uniref:Calcyclin-binding protein n=2 Tax=Homalodisca TaxID=139475 RepID=A0A1B6H7D3_9HEMI
MSSKLEELKSDVEELNKLLSQSTRQKCKDILTLEIRKVQTEISRLQEQIGSSGESIKPTSVVPQQSRCYEVKLNNYAWDQSDKFVKIFVTLKNVHTLPAENVYTVFTENSMELHMNKLDNRNYTLPLKNLLEKIDGSKSSWKVKTDMVVVSLAKEETGKTWSHLTSSEKKAKEPKPTPKLSDNADPSAGLMDLMKQMYEDGDDDMKRSIAKAWTESRNNSGMPSF